MYVGKTILLFPNVELSQVVNQNSKLEKMEKNMSVTTEKQTVVNARQRYLLK